MTLPTYQNITVHEFKNSRLTEKEVAFSAEYPVTLIINGNPYMTVACSGTELESYAVGHLATEGIIQQYSDIEAIEIDEDSLTVNVRIVQSDHVSRQLTAIKILSAAGGRSRKELPASSLVRNNPPPVRPSIILTCMNRFLTHSKERDLTHGVHSSALFTRDGEMLVFFNEIGRHNAIDKSIGYAVRNRIPLDDKMIFTSGRLSSEITLKIVLSGIPILVSRASPTTYSIALLKRYNIITLSRFFDESCFVINGAEHLLL